MTGQFLSGFTFRTLRAAAALIVGLSIASPAFADKPDKPPKPPVLESPVLPPAVAEKGDKPQKVDPKGFKKGVVSVANPYAAEAGAQILEEKGNAIDAAVAIVYALNVVEPQSAGVGGGGFMLIHLAKTDETFFIDTREKAPSAATNNMFVGVPSASLQGVAVGVPGMVRGTAVALEQFGKKKLKDVLKPAIRLADEGFAATPRYAGRELQLAVAEFA